MPAAMADAAPPTDSRAPLSTICPAFCPTLVRAERMLSSVSVMCRNGTWARASLAVANQRSARSDRSVFCIHRPIPATISPICITASAAIPATGTSTTTVASTKVPAAATPAFVLARSR